MLHDPEVYEDYKKREKEIEIAWYEAEEGYEQSGALQENDLFASYAEQEVAEQEQKRKEEQVETIRRRKQA